MTSTNASWKRRCEKPSRPQGREERDSRRRQAHAMTLQMTGSNDETGNKKDLDDAAKHERARALQGERYRR